MQTNRSDIAAFNNILSQMCNQVYPQNYVSNAAAWFYQQIGTQAFGNDWTSEITVANVYSGHPNVDYTTEKYLNNNYSILESDITIPLNNGMVYGEGSGNFLDRRTVLRRAFCESFGLRHTRNAGYLMYGTLAYGEVRQIDQDAINGFRCLYDNLCSGNECGTGAVQVLQGVRTDALTPTLTWNVGQGQQDIRGFNVYRKRGATYQALNPALIRPQSGTSDYAFALPAGQPYKAGLYFLETVLRDRNNTTTFSPFKH